MPGNAARKPLLRQFLLPNIAEVLLCLVMGIGLLLASNFNFLKDAWTKDYSTARQAQIERRDEVPIVDPYQKASPLAIASTLIFWGGVGGMSYMLIWFMQNVYRTSKNQSQAAQYIMPAGYSKEVYVRSTLSKNALACGSAFALAAFFIGTYRYVLPRIGELSLRPFLAETKAIGDYIACVASLLVMMVVVFVFLRLVRVTSYAWRAFFA